MAVCRTLSTAIHSRAMLHAPYTVPSWCDACHILSCGGMQVSRALGAKRLGVTTLWGFGGWRSSLGRRGTTRCRAGSTRTAWTGWRVTTVSTAREAREEIRSVVARLDGQIERPHAVAAMWDLKDLSVGKRFGGQRSELHGQKIQSEYFQENLLWRPS